MAWFLAGCGDMNQTSSKSDGNAGPAEKLAEFQTRAAKYDAVVSLPTFETSTNEIQATLTNTIKAGDAALDRVGQLKPAEVNFTNTVRALDDLGFQLGLIANRFSLIQQTSTNADVRDSTTEAIKQLESWMVGLDYREDVYRAVKAYEDTRPRLTGEDAKLLSETMRDYRRAGLELPKAGRDEVERMRKELYGLETDFENNVTKADKPVTFTKAELDGVPEDFARAGSREQTTNAS